MRLERKNIFFFMLMLIMVLSLSACGKNENDENNQSKISCIDDIAGISKAVKLNAGMIDRMISGKTLENNVKEILKEARTGFSENRVINVIKPQHNQPAIKEETLVK